MKELPDYIQFKHTPGTPLQHIFTAAGDDVLLLLEKLLAIDPLVRCSCTEALKLPYFR
jgi:cyclin-dependent kinase 7